MKKLTLVLLMVFTIVTYSQKKKNGTIYSEHPAIDVVEDLKKAFVAGDSDKVMSLLADDYKYWNGTNSNKDAKPGTREGAGKNVKWWKENVAYLSMERTNGAYPDAIEYKDDNQKDVVWVQTWDHLKGVHNGTGVKIDMPVHRLYVVNADNKIETVIDYSDRTVWRELNESFEARKNGTIYNHHDYINSVRRMMAALENKDMEKFYSYYHDDARFRNIHMAVGTDAMTLEQDREGMQKMMEAFDITSIDVQGYPDYLNYGLGNAKVVQSWWKVRMTRKSDDKKIVMPLFLIHDFDDDGKIVGENAYYSASLMQN
ncbi:nuclear transport factor 2 family protein [Lutimonas zeaxanthinifaciens]|uniref:nuclear transport factor 2 family protein n=1 Tax=Lutimonas zeaxanthinifaciens TaxID=3060215 RepID=UPI00265D3D85|nr:nuclear transport factor 2 family protein [Lutimonas sp. YSD2104]WKK65353.1 nuclear transport factor 2 family protein [Lutimonas sp. YSD2104]